MRCWNCQAVLPADDGDLCPQCRVARAPARASRSEFVGFVVAAAATGVGYYFAGWMGVMYGLSAGVPLGCTAAVLWPRATG